MGLPRLALRLATLEALRPDALVVEFAGGAAIDALAWPTLAQSHVYDSRQDPFDDLRPEERRPVVSVFTELDNGDPGQYAGGPPFEHAVDLVFELSVVARLDSGADPAVYEPGWALTDAELESDLDLLEAQVLFALNFGPSGALWRTLTGRRESDLQSIPQRTSEEAARLARRSLRMKVMLDDAVYLAAPPAGLSGNDRLAEPLKSVVAALAATSYGRKLAAGLSARAPMMPVAVPLEGATLEVNVARPDGTHDDQARVIASAEDLNL